MEAHLALSRPHARFAVLSRRHGNRFLCVQCLDDRYAGLVCGDVGFKGTYHSRTNGMLGRPDYVTITDDFYDDRLALI